MPLHSSEKKNHPQFVHFNIDKAFNIYHDERSQFTDFTSDKLFDYDENDMFLMASSKNYPKKSETQAFLNRILTCFLVLEENDKENIMPEAGLRNPSDHLSSNSLRKKSATSSGFLHTEARAVERGKLYYVMKEKRRLDDQMKRELEAERLRREQEETQRLRNMRNFRAQPIKQYKPIEIKPSEKPLTEPKAPHLRSANLTHHTRRFNPSDSRHPYHHK
jgi:hypothetical protein